MGKRPTTYRCLGGAPAKEVIQVYESLCLARCLHAGTVTYCRRKDRTLGTAGAFSERLGLETNPKASLASACFNCLMLAQDLPVGRRNLPLQPGRRDIHQSILGISFLIWKGVSLCIWSATRACLKLLEVFSTSNKQSRTFPAVPLRGSG